MAGCEPVALHRRLHRRRRRCPLPVTSLGEAAARVRRGWSTGDGSGGGRWVGKDGADAGADVGADAGEDEGDGVVEVAGTTPVGAAASTPAGGCWCSRTGSALGSFALRSGPDGADGRRMCIAAAAVAPVPPPLPPLPPQSTSTVTAAINSPGSKREPVTRPFNLIIPSISNFYFFLTKIHQFKIINHQNFIILTAEKLATFHKKKVSEIGQMQRKRPPFHQPIRRI